MRQRERMQRSRRHSLLRRLAHGVPRRFVFGAFALISHSASPTPKPTLMEHAMGNVPFRPVATGSTTHEAPRAVIRHCHGCYSPLVCRVTHRKCGSVPSWRDFQIGRSHMNRRTVCLTAVFGTLSPPSVFAQEGKVTVFAAASMKDALDEINAAFTKSTGIKVDASYAGSQTLVQLIEEGS